MVPPGQFPPPGVDEPLVLDCGFGNGAWIDDLLGVREYEDCKVRTSVKHSLFETGP